MQYKIFNTKLYNCISELIYTIQNVKKHFILKITMARQNKLHFRIKFPYFYSSETLWFSTEILLCEHKFLIFLQSFNFPDSLLQINTTTL